MQSQAFANRNGEPSEVVTGLHPYSNYNMYIVVANNRFEGPPSNNIHFSTPEGGKIPLSKRQDALGAMSSHFQTSRVLFFSSVFASSTICSQILQNPTATSWQYLCRLGCTSGTQRHHYWIFPEVPDRYGLPTRDYSVFEGNTHLWKLGGFHPLYSERQQRRRTARWGFPSKRDQFLHSAIWPLYSIQILCGGPNRDGNRGVVHRGVSALHDRK